MSARKHPDKMPAATLWWLSAFCQGTSYLSLTSHLSGRVMGNNAKRGHQIFWWPRALLMNGILLMSLCGSAFGCSGISYTLAFCGILGGTAACGRSGKRGAFSVRSDSSPSTDSSFRFQPAYKIPDSLGCPLRGATMTARVTRLVLQAAAGFSFDV